jgi:hypothetical protein
MPMTNYTEQIQRIRDKLLEAKNTDKNLKVFGAASHRYIIHEPATLKKVTEIETKYSIELPECYKAFILNIGNGGFGSQNSAAGPFYGIYPVGVNINELIFNNAEEYLKNDCIIIPKMTDEYWKSITMNIEENEVISNEDYETESGKLWAGILPIGSQGCSYIHGIVLNGPHKGRVVNLDIDRLKPQFTFENNFLDWYERWLDEIISGELIKDVPSWFGYSKGGSEEQLLASFLTSKDLEEKNDNLSGLLNKNTLSNQTLNQIENLINSNSEPKNILIQLLCKSDYARAKPYLIELTKTDLCSAFQFIYWYAKDKSKEWITVIENNIHRIDNDEMFIFCSYLLKETNTDYGRLIEPFTKNINDNIRVQAFYTLGLLKNKKDYLDCFIEGLQDKSNKVVHSTLQALSGVKDKKLLNHYKQIAERFPIEQDYILANLNHRLADYGLTNKTILNQNSPEQSTKKWYEIWK